MNKGSRHWFDEIVGLLGNRLVGIEVSHYSKNQDISPRCQVTFVLKEFYASKTPAEITGLCNVEGFRMLHWAIRGEHKGDHSDMRTTAKFDFRDNEECPRRTMLEVAQELGFTVAPKFLNSETSTARLSPTIY